MSLQSPGFWKYRSAGGSVGPPSILAAHFAAGTRLLISGYGDSCMRVRRSSDDAEQDIGFSGNGLDTASLATFVGANSGYVVRLYNQGSIGHGTSNGYDLTQTTKASQPRIVNAGTLETLNGKPAINVLAGTWMGQEETSHWLAVTDDYTWAAVCSQINNGYGRDSVSSWTWQIFCGSVNGGPYVVLTLPTTPTSYQLSGTPSATTKGRVYRIDQNSPTDTTHSYRENDSAFSSATVSGYSLRLGGPPRGLMMGRANNTTGSVDGKCTEYWSWKSVLSSADETMLTGQWQTLYGI